MKTAVLLSGGVDSSVALSLLKQEGRDLRAFYLKIWLEDELSFLGECPWEEDLQYAHQVCDQQQVPLEIIPLQEDYRKLVVSQTISELKQGRTPSPDILCNKQIKFGAFINSIDPSFEQIASGHYAQTEVIGNLVWLKQAPDLIKDQTYFLSALKQEQIRKIIFPIGHLQKKTVRELAKQFNLANRARKDSQGICFLGKIKYPDFVKHHLGEQIGDIIDQRTGEKIGEHKGVWFHTLGQRKGLNLSGGPWYVSKKDLDNNLIFVTHGNIAKGEKIKKLSVGPVNWIATKPTDHHLQVKLRHGPHKSKAKIEYLDNEQVLVELETADSGAAPGQSVIFYQESYCLGGGVIQTIQ